MPDEVRVGPVGRVMLGVVAIATIAGLFVVLAKENLRLTAANAQLQLELERVNGRLVDLLTKPVTLPPGLVKPAAPLGELRWAGDRYIFIPPVPSPPTLKNGRKQATAVPSPPPAGTGCDHGPALPPTLPRPSDMVVGGEVVNQPPPVPQAHPVKVPGYEPAESAGKK